MENYIVWLNSRNVMSSAQICIELSTFMKLLIALHLYLCEKKIHIHRHTTSDVCKVTDPGDTTGRMDRNIMCHWRLFHCLFFQENCMFSR